MISRDLKLHDLELMPSSRRLALLCDRKEDQWLERKSVLTKAWQIANTMVGMANAEGGIIVIGIYDGKVEGIQTADPDNSWRQAAMDFTAPPVRHTFTRLSCTNSQGQPDEIIVIEVEASEHVHTNQKGETFLRVGDETRRLNNIESQELLYDKGESNYDGTALREITLRSLDTSLVDKYLKNVGADSKQKINALKARGLVKDYAGVPRPAIAGLIILGNRPQTVLPHAYIRVLAYQGSSRETGTRANVILDKRLDGPLSQQIDRASVILKQLLPQTTRLGSKNVFKQETMVPEYVWLEALVNAAIHRSYSLGGDHIRVEVFSDRIEVKSPGRLPGLVRLDNIRSTRFARNPRISRALSDIRYGRELGEGVNRMFEEMHSAGLPDPIYEQGSAFVKVILLADPLAGRVLRYLPRGSERFVEFLSRENRVTTVEAAELLGVTRPTARKHLNLLAQQKLIAHVGVSTNDPRGYWKMNTEAKSEQ